MHLNVDVELVAQLSDVAPALANEVVGKPLRELELQTESALLLVLFLLLDEGAAFRSQSVDGRSGTPDVNRGPQVRNTNGNLIRGPCLLLLLYEPPELVVEPKARCC